MAKQHLKTHPIEIGGENQGPWVRLYCQGNEGSPDGFEACERTRGVVRSHYDFVALA